MQVIIGGTPKAVGRMAASVFQTQLLRKPDSVLGLATGSTPLPLYEALVQMHKDGMLDASRMSSFNLDEYVGLPTSHPQSYYAFMWAHLFAGLGLRQEQASLPNGAAADLGAECGRYDAAIAAAGGIDLQLLGVGHNGHIGFNEPGEAFGHGTRVVELTRSTIEANRRFFASEDDVPRRALTMGIQTIFQARSIVLIVTGAEKASIVRAMVEGDITPKVPASILQLHPNTLVFVDEAAAAQLTR